MKSIFWLFKLQKFIYITEVLGRFMNSATARRKILARDKDKARIKGEPIGLFIS